MQVNHKHRYKYYKKLDEDICACLDTRKHVHKWKIYRQDNHPLLTTKTFEKCVCGKTQSYWSNPAGRFQFSDLPKLSKKFFISNFNKDGSIKE